MDHRPPDCILLLFNVTCSQACILYSTCLQVQKNKNWHCHHDKVFQMLFAMLSCFRYIFLFRILFLSIYLSLKRWLAERYRKPRHCLHSQAMLTGWGCEGQKNGIWLWTLDSSWSISNILGKPASRFTFCPNEVLCHDNLDVCDRCAERFNDEMPRSKWFTSLPSSLTKDGYSHSIVQNTLIYTQLPVEIPQILSSWTVSLRSPTVTCSDWGTPWAFGQDGAPWGLDLSKQVRKLSDFVWSALIRVFVEVSGTFPGTVSVSDSAIDLHLYCRHR